MLMTDFISVNGEADYEVNRPIYVSFYNWEDFQETILIEQAQETLDLPEGAENVRLSFTKIFWWSNRESKKH